MESDFACSLESLGHQILHEYGYWNWGKRLQQVGKDFQLPAEKDNLVVVGVKLIAGGRDFCNFAYLTQAFDGADFEVILICDSLISIIELGFVRLMNTSSWCFATKCGFVRK
jgi:hypothetical protein